MMTRDKVLANRLKWIEFLQDPKRRKFKHYLDNGHGARCCLGHGCRALGIERSVHADGYVAYGHENDMEMAPDELVVALGLWDHQGAPKVKYSIDLMVLDGQVISDLVELNDETRATPYEIGEYLETVVYGGDKTPFRPLTDYPEEAP